MASRIRTRITNNDTMGQRVAYGPGMLLFSLPFLGAGGFFAAFGFGWIEVELDGVNAPLWVIGCVGLAFFLAGALIAVHAVRGLLHRSRMREQARMHPGRRWLSDFPWDQQGARDAAGRKVVVAFFGLVFFAVFLAPFNWWAWLSPAGGFFVKAIVTVFDVGLLFGIFGTLKRVVHFLKYGYSHVVFEQFPFFLGDEVRVRFGPARGEKMRFTLRCVEEYWETSGSGRNRSKRLVTDRLYCDEQIVETGPITPEVDLRFRLPDDPELATRFDPLPVRYWQLRVQADVPGVDLDTCLPIPVYESRSSRGGSGGSGTRSTTAASGGSVSGSE